jgi:hypothetical protein
VRRKRTGAAKGGDDAIALFSRRAMKVTNGGSGAPSFVVPCLSAALNWVERYCLLELLRRIRWFGRDFWIDIYVIGHFGLAAVSYVLSFRNFAWSAPWQKTTK